MSEINVSVASPTSVSIAVTGGIGPQGAAGAGGVASLNTYTGAITLVGAGGASISGVTAASGATITITAGGGGGGGGGLVDSVNGLTGTVVLNSVSVSAAASVHTHHADDISSFAVSAAAAAPVQSVNGVTGAVVLNAASVTAAGTAVLTTINGLTGAVQIGGVNITVATAGTAITLTGSAGGGAVASVAGATGTVTITAIGLATSQSGSAVTLDARPVRVTPTTVNSRQDNWQLGVGDIFRIDNRTTANLDITGFSTTSSSLEVLVFNVSTHTAATFTLKHQNTNSTAANRLVSPWAGDVLLPPNGGSAAIVYDPADTRWRVP